jgi:hypothetical protein
MPQNSPKNPSTRKTRKIPTVAEIKSSIRNILLASPLFPRFYADVVLSTAPNSNEAKILARNYEKIIERTNTDQTNTDQTINDQTKDERKNLDTTKRTNMPNSKHCTHIMLSPHGQIPRYARNDKLDR